MGHDGHYFIEPGKLRQDAHLESFNGEFRNEGPNEHWLLSEVLALTTAQPGQYKNRA